MTTVTVPTPLGRWRTQRLDGDPDRPPLVLGHGILLSSRLWVPVVDLLRADPAHGGRTVVLVDGPGHGGSDPAPPGWALADHAAALVTVLDAHGVDRAVLAGQSWGGMVALRAALAHPDRVAAVGLVNTPLTRAAGLARAGFAAQRLLLRTAGPSAFYARRAAAALYDRASRAAQPGLADAMVADLRGRSGAVLADALRAVVLDPPEHVTALRRVGVPLAVVAGARDYVLPADVRDGAVAAGAAVTVVAGGHVSPEEDPRGVAAALADLLRRADAVPQLTPGR